MILARYQNNKGFTLVELMTVVAIIGALAALGVPQYKKMQRKAKRAEATMGLGVIASAEAAFFAEYNGYGDNMGGIGAELDGAPQYYNMGFLQDAAPHAPRINVAPAAAAGFQFCEATVGCAPNPRSFPAYQGSSVRYPVANGGNNAGGVPQDGSGTYELRAASGFQAMQPRVPTTAAAGVPANPNSWEVLATPRGNACPNLQANNLVSQNGDNVGFLAVAAGNLFWNTANTTQMDCVSINRQRTINIFQDGT